MLSLIQCYEKIGWTFKNDRAENSYTVKDYIFDAHGAEHVTVFLFS